MAVVLVKATLTTRRNVRLLTSPGIELVQGQETQRYACLERLMRQQIPAGAEVVDDGAPGLDYQRIAEELTPGYRFVREPRPGAYVVSFRATGPCGGAGIRVRRQVLS